jgi:hypothetical protein
MTRPLPSVSKIQHYVRTCFSLPLSLSTIRIPVTRLSVLAAAVHSKCIGLFTHARSRCAKTTAATHHVGTQTILFPAHDPSVTLASL